MKKIALLAGIGLVSFVVGLAALYFAMPYIQPDKVEAVRAELDSLRALAADSLLVMETIDAQIEAELVLSDTTAADSTGPRAIPLEEHPRFVALLDSLAYLTALAQAGEQDRTRLLAQVDELTEASTVSVETSADLTELSGTLTRLEENELRPILERLDDGTVARLYEEATGRNRTKILRSLRPERAARLVQRMAGRPMPPTQAASLPVPSDNDRPNSDQPEADQP